MRNLSHILSGLIAGLTPLHGAQAAPPSNMMADQGEPFSIATPIYVVTFVCSAGFLLLTLGLLFEHQRFRRAEARSMEQARQMAQADRTLIAGAMSASIAHELNQALAAILANAETALIMLDLQGVNVKQLKKIVTDIERDDSRAASIVGHLRGFLRERHPRDVRILDLNETVKSAVDLVTPEARKRKIALATVRERQPLLVQVDPVHVQQVVFKLVLNFLDSVNGAVAEPAIAVRVASFDDAEAEVSISDSGFGIPVEAINESFTATGENSAGLDPSIVRTIVEKYNGRIWAENKLAGGVSVRFRLPLAKAHS